VVEMEQKLEKRGKPEEKLGRGNTLKQSDEKGRNINIQREQSSHIAVRTQSWSRKRNSNGNRNRNPTMACKVPTTHTQVPEKEQSNMRIFAQCVSAI